MSTVRILSLIVFPFFLIGCNPNTSKTKITSLDTNSIIQHLRYALNDSSINTIDAQRSENKEKLIKKKLKLKYDFEIRASKGEDFGTFSTYSSFTLIHNGKVVFVDTSQAEYEFGDKLYPIIYALDSITFEILVEVNDRPNKNYLKYFKINNDSIIELKKLPTFITKPLNFGQDGNLEFAGFWDYNEVWGENGSITDYNPILFYKITKEGLVLDTVLTIKTNKAIYGSFKGFHYSEKYDIPISCGRKFAKEIQRIEKLGN